MPSPPRDVSDATARAALPDLTELAARLRARPPREVFRWVPARRAAVAIVLDPAGRVLLMERAAREGDRWSSHVSLPGGMSHPRDASLLATATRETREEVGLDLSTATPLGALDDVRALANASVRPMSVTPYVFRLDAPAELVAGPEAAATFWLPLDRAARGELDDRLRWPVLGVRVAFPCWRYEGRAVWGLTYGILRDLLRRARR